MFKYPLAIAVAVLFAVGPALAQTPPPHHHHPVHHVVHHPVHHPKHHHPHHHPVPPKA